MDELLEQQVQDGSTKTRDRRRRGGKQNELAVENRSTAQLRDSIKELNNKVKKLNSLVNKLSINHKAIKEKDEVVKKVRETSKMKNDFRQSDVRDRIDFSTVEDIFDDLWAEDIGSMLFSVVNLTMMGVILISGFLWFKLDTYEKNN